MRQLTCVAPGEVEWIEVPEPTLEGPDEALVRPLAVARCEIDPLLIRNGPPAGVPFALGHEAVASIVAVGSGAAAAGFSVGQIVVPAFQVSCGACGRCGAGQSAVCERYPVLSDYGMQPLSGVEFGGMLSDVVRVPHAAAMLHAAPVGVTAGVGGPAGVADPAAGVLGAGDPTGVADPAPGGLAVGGPTGVADPAPSGLAVGGPTGVADPAPGGLAVVDLAGVADNVADGFRAVAPHLAERPGADVLVACHGLRSIALFAAQAAVALGAGQVTFASDDSEALALAESVGARPLRTGFDRRDGRFPIVVDCGTSAAGLRYAVDSTEPEGVCHSVSLYVEAPDASLPLVKMYTLGIRFLIGRAHATAVIPEVLSLVASGRLRPQDITTRRVSWDDAAEAYLDPTVKLVVARDEALPAM